MNKLKCCPLVNLLHVLIVFLSLTISSHAAVHLYEGFNGDLNSSTIGWGSNTWVINNGGTTLEPQSLSFGDYQTNGGSMSMGWVTPNSRLLATPINLSSSEKWMAFLFRYDDVSPFNPSQFLTNGNDWNQDTLRYGNGGPGAPWKVTQQGGVWAGAGFSEQIDVDTDGGKVWLVVTKFTPSGSEVNAKIWVYTDPLTVPDTAPTSAGSAASYQDLTFNPANATIRDITIRGSGAATYDEIRIADTFDEAVTFGAPSTPPPAPINIYAQAASDTSVNVEWEGLGDSYYVQYRQSGSSIWSNSPSTTGSSLEVAGLTTNVQYDFQVIASNAAGDSSPSSIVTGTPVAGASILLAYEPFDGDLNNTGTGFTGTWTGLDGGIGYSTQDLTFGTLRTKGGSLTSYYSRQYERSFTTPINASTTEPVYLSYMYHYVGDSQFNRAALYINGTSGEDNIIMGNGAPGQAFGIQKLAGSWAGHSTSAFNVEQGGQYFIVAKITNDKMELWGYSSISQVPDDTPTGQGTALGYESINLGLTSLTINKLVITNFVEFGLDEIRVGRNFANVTPRDAVTQAPEAPTSLSAIATGPNSIKLEWTSNSTTEDGFYVYRGTSSGNYAPTPVATIDPGITSYTDNSLTEGTTYYYQVTAFNSIGESTATNETSATPVALNWTIAKTAELRIMCIGDSITFGGTDGGYRTRLKTLLASNGYNDVSFKGRMVTGTDDYHEGYSGKTIDQVSDIIQDSEQIVLSQQPNLLLIMLGTNNLQYGNYPSPNSWDSQNRFYPWDAMGDYQSLIEYISDTVPNATILIGSLPPSVVSSTEQNAVNALGPIPTPGTTAFGTFASNANAASGYKYNEYATFGTGSSKYTGDYVNAFNTTGINGDPGLQNLVATLQSAGRKVQLVTDTHIATSGLSSDGLHPQATGYQTMAQAWYDAIASVSVDSAPTAPTSLTAAAGPDKVTLSWTNTSVIADSVKVQRRISGGTWGDIATLSGSATTHIDQNAIAGTTYEYRVYADNAIGASPYSNTATATPTAGVQGSLTLTDPIKILPIGDSITHGSIGSGSSTYYNYSPGAPYNTYSGFSDYPAYVIYGPGYRRYLKDLLDNNSYNFTAYVGTQAPSGSGGDHNAGQYNTLLQSPFDQHEGYPGKRSDHLYAYLFGGIDPDNNPNTIPGNQIVSTQQPNVILLLLGTNDVIQGTYKNANFGNGTLDERSQIWFDTYYKQAVLDAFTDGPSNLHIFAGTLPTLSSANNFANEDRVDARLRWNQHIRDLVDELQTQGKNIFLVEHDNIPQGDDGVHPHPEGYQIMANNWLNAIKAATPGASTAYETWANTNMPSANTTQKAMTYDYDGDGIVNMIEYAMGGNPAQRADDLYTVSASGNYLSITFKRDTSVSDVTIAVERASSLSGPWTKIAESINGANVTASGSFPTGNITNGSGTTVTVTDNVPVSSSPAFLRITVSQ